MKLSLIMGLLLGLVACQSKVDSPIVEQSVSKAFDIPAIEILVDSLQILANKGKVFYHGAPFTGFAVDYYDEKKQLKYRKGHWQGKRNGLTEKWYANGQIKEQIYYFENRIHGSKKAYWLNGTQRSDYFLDNGELSGKAMEWYESGEKFRQRNFIDGLEHGMQKAWRKNGSLYVNYEAKDGRIFGKRNAHLCYEIDSLEQIKK